ncbi:MAG: initiation control protein YabA [Syntrophomonadaceae bacterium]|nr:initiation control protein YabA [Syntrophomonadaceae bacterium]
MHISHRLAEAEAKLEALRQELDSIKAWALELEEENRRLRAQLFEISSPPLDREMDDPPPAEGRPEGGFATLERLYREEFHICPYNFGQRRSEGCLFCLNFLDRARNCG